MNILEEMIANAEAEAADIAAGKPPRTACGCDRARIEERMVLETIPFGDEGETFQVETPVVHCLDCKFGYTDYRAERLRHAALCRHLGLPVPGDDEPVPKYIDISGRRDRG